MLDLPTVRIASAAIGVAMAVLVFLGAHTIANVPLFPSPFDKAAHFVYYGVMAMLLAHSVGVRRWWLAGLVALLIGMADEWNQSSVPGRDASVWDFVADTAGAAVFLYVYRYAKSGSVRA